MLFVFGILAIVAAANSYWALCVFSIVVMMIVATNRVGGH